MNAQEMITEVMKDRKGNHIRLNLIHEIWHAHIDWCQEHRQFAGVVAPWGHGKTEQIIGRILNELGEDNDLRLKIVCDTDSNAAARVGSIKRYIESDTDYHRIYPNVRPSRKGLFKLKKGRKINAGAETWMKHTIILDRKGKMKDPSVEAFGITSSGIGTRADGIVFDDPCNLKNTILEPGSRETVKENYENTWISRLEDLAWVLYIATIWHEQDLTSTLIKNSRYSFCIMAINDELNGIKVKFTNIDETHPCWTGQDEIVIPLWEEKFNHDALIKKLEELGPIAFARGFKQIPWTDTDIWFPSFKNCKEPDITPESWLQYARRQVKDKGKKIYFATGVDLSSSKRPGNVITTIGMIEGENVNVIVDIKKGAWKSPQTAGNIVETFKEFKPIVIKVENVALQEAIMEWIEVESEKGTYPNMPIEGFMTGKSKSDPQIGMPYLDVEFKNKMWLIPTGQIQDHETGCSCPWCELISSMESFPFASKTDTVMSCFTPGTKIMTSEGYVDIENIKVGDLVYTHKARWRKVLNIFKRKINEKIIKISPWTRNSVLFTTKNHPFYTAEISRRNSTLKESILNETIDFKKVEDLKNTRRKNGQNVLLMPFSDEEKLVKPIMLRKKYNNLKRAKTKLYSNYNTEEVKGEFKDLEWGFFIGLFMAEGWAKGNRISFALNRSEMNLAKFISEFAKNKLGVLNVCIRPSTDNSYNGMLVHFAHKELSKRFRKLFGTHCWNKRFPVDWLLLPKDFQMSMLKGWLVGDGTYNRKNYVGISGGSISRELVWQMSIFALRNKVIGGIRWNKQNNSVNKIYKESIGMNKNGMIWGLCINKYYSNILFDKKIGNVEKLFRNKFLNETKPKNIHNTSMILEGISALGMKIKTKEEIDYKGWVYNIEVEEDNSYLAEDVMVHNCWFAREGMKKYTGGSVMSSDDYEEVIKNAKDGTISNMDYRNTEKYMDRYLGGGSSGIMAESFAGTGQGGYNW